MKSKTFEADVQNGEIGESFRFPLELWAGVSPEDASADGKPSETPLDSEQQLGFLNASRQEAGSLAQSHDKADTTIKEAALQTWSSARSQSTSGGVTQSAGSEESAGTGRGEDGGASLRQIGGRTAETGGVPSGQSGKFVDPLANGGAQDSVKTDTEQGAPAQMKAAHKSDAPAFHLDADQPGMKETSERHSGRAAVGGGDSRRGDGEESFAARQAASTGSLRSSSETHRPPINSEERPAVTPPDARSGLTGNSGAEAEPRDNSLLQSHTAGPEKTAHVEGNPRVADNSQTGARGGIMEQIVHKAGFQLKDGLNEVRIELKPEFLGHVRMQISSEHHQLAVRIIAELPVVRDMIENNIQQLKTVLQQQGFEVDELEVLVADDSNRRHDPNTNSAGSRSRHRIGRLSAKSMATAADSLGMPTTTRRSGDEGAVDTFV